MHTSMHVHTLYHNGWVSQPEWLNVRGVYASVQHDCSLTFISSRLHGEETPWDQLHALLPNSFRSDWQIATTKSMFNRNNTALLTRLFQQISKRVLKHACIVYNENTHIEPCKNAALHKIKTHDRLIYSGTHTHVHTQDTQLFKIPVRFSTDWIK